MGSTDLCAKRFQLVAGCLVRTYYINLDRRPDRRDRMDALAKARGLDVTRIAAVDAAAADFSTLAQDMMRKGPTGEMSDGTLACTLSHFKTWKTFVDDPSAGDHAVVLEDDVVLAPSTHQVLADLSAAHLAGYGLVKLELFDTMTKGAFVGRTVPLSDGFALRDSFQILAGAAAYVITRDLARRLLDYRSAIRVPIDHFLFYPRAVPGFWGGPYAVLDPPVAQQDPTTVSDIAAVRNVGSKRKRAWSRFGYEAAQTPLILRKLLAGQARLVKFDGTQIVATD